MSDSTDGTGGMGGMGGAMEAGPKAAMQAPTQSQILIVDPLISDY
jgi:hypothetical protein